MARQIENSLDRFAPGQPSLTAPLIAAGVGVLLFAGLVVSLASGAYALTGIFALSLAGLAAFAFVSLRDQRRLLGTKAAGWIDWETVVPEVQRENLRIAVTELSRILKPDADSDLQTAFVVAEDLAFRQLQQDEAVPVLRHVTAAGVPFDAVLVKNDVLICCEVAFLVASELRQDRVVAMMKKIAAVKRSIDSMNIGMQVRLMPVLITQMQSAEVAKLRESLSTNRFSSTPADIDIRLFDFEELQRTYISE